MLIAISVDAQGKVREPYILSSPSPMLSQSSLETLAHWKFDPEEVDGKPTTEDQIIGIIFDVH